LIITTKPRRLEGTRRTRALTAKLAKGAKGKFEMETNQANGAAGAGKMSPAEREAALREAERLGVDIEQLRQNLKLTPAQRLARHQIRLYMSRILELARAFDGA
jgi:hypothetical protein